MTGNTIKILREHRISLDVMENVYKWASLLTAENRYAHNGDEDYFITDSAKLLYFKLKHVERGLIGVIGLQGSGKTSLLHNMSAYFGKKALFIKWGVNWRKELEEENQKLFLEFVNVETFLCSFRYIFIDFPDYDKKSRNQMNKDLNDFSALWKATLPIKAKNLSPPTFVLGIQKEMYKGHFLYGKLDEVYLKPLTPHEMVNAYRRKWENLKPFTEDALLLIAEMSRGIFRRFLRYIMLCIEDAVSKKKLPSLTSDNVKEAITFEQIMKDMDLELSDVFSTKEQKMLAVKLLNALREVKEINQKELTELADANEKAVSRIMIRLESYGYIKRRRGERKEWLVSLC